MSVSRTPAASPFPSTQPHRRHESPVGPAMEAVAAVMAQLRGPEGCVWTRSQTLQSLWPYLIEEAHEAAHAARSNDVAELQEELGDVLLQVVYQSAICEEAGHFGLADVARTLQDKLIRRHPHVFAAERADTPAAVARQWEEVKAQERAARAARGQRPKGRLSGLPATLPALIYAQRVTDKAASIGFDWPDHLGAAHKVQEELQEVLQAAQEVAREAAQPSPSADGAKRAQAHLEEELGDLLLSVVNVCRHLGVQAEGALLSAVGKFSRRFAYVEAGVAQQPEGQQGELDDLQRLWDEAKADKL